jgi:hypothetical protein
MLSGRVPSEEDLHAADPFRVVVITMRERPEKVQVIGKDDPRMEGERSLSLEARSEARRAWTLRSELKSGWRPCVTMVKKYVPPGTKLRWYSDIAITGLRFELKDWWAVPTLREGEQLP